jgi:hypothetical protein
MSSKAFECFQKNIVGALVLTSQVGNSSCACTDQSFVDQTYLKSAVAFAVGCWEGYVESAIREFVSKVRVQAHRQTWTLISQFEIIVDKKASMLNTPNWEKVREFLIEITGMDVYAGWIWSPKFKNQIETKEFVDGIISVRHAYAHGFDIPADVPGLSAPGTLDAPYVDDVISCIKFLASKTDELLEHELMHRHSCRSGWN